MTLGPTPHSQMIGQNSEILRSPQSRPRQAVIPSGVIDVLVAGLELTEASLDYTETYAMHKQAADSGLLQNGFDPILPKFAEPDFTQSMEHIRRAAHRTVEEFNMIAWHIGGIPVKIENDSGIIMSLKDYDEGEWVYVFTNKQHTQGRDVRGVTQKLRDWHQASITGPMSLLPEQFES